MIIRVSDGPPSQNARNPRDNVRTSSASAHDRLFHDVLGHIALKLLVYTEHLSGGVRRANAKKTLKKQEEVDEEE